MKHSLKIIYLFLIFQFSLNSTFSQTTFKCGTIPPPPAMRPAQPSNSLQLLVDLVQYPNDRQLEVKVKFWVFLPTYESSLTSVWTHSLNPSTQNSFAACMADVNSTFTNIPISPGFSVPGYTYGLTDAKLKFTHTVQYVVNDQGYLDVSGFASGVYTTSAFGFTYYDPNAINVYVGTTSYTFNAGTTPDYVVTNYLPDSPIAAVGNPASKTASTNCVFVDPEFFGVANVISVPNGTALTVRANIESYGGILAHEFCHILGLYHPTQDIGNCFGQVPTPIFPSFGCNTLSEVLDVPLETYTCTLGPTGWVKLFPATSCTTIGAGDNLMSQNGGCNRFLSPQQIAVMHYYLRTELRHLLTSSGYIAAVNTNTLFDQVISTNTTWQNGDRYFKGSIYINPDITLTIKCGVALSKGAKIYIPPRAQLVIDGGTVTSICGQVWDGIYIEGSPSQPAGISGNTVNPGSSLYQGVLRMLNNGTISQATVGVRNYGTNSLDAGGIILALNGNFINNVTDVQIQGSGQTNLAPTFNPSWFTYCNFLTNGIIGNTLTPKGHVRLYKCIGVQFRGSTFQHTTAVNGSRGYGIYSTDASYIVDQMNVTPCKFENLDYGIKIANINPLLNPVIKNNTFINNQYAGNFFNSSYLSFITNTILIANYSNCNGLYVNQCNNYKIRNNSISSINYSGPGIEVYRSLGGSHEIFRNTFSRVNVGINCMDVNNSNNNDGLLMNCNVFNLNANYYDIVMSYTSGLANPTVKKVQGQVLGAPSATNLVRNIYGATCVGNQNKWQIYTAATQTVDHGANTNSTLTVTQPTPNTTCKSQLLNVVDMGMSLSYATDCTLYPPSSGGSSSSQSSRLSSLNDYIGNLQASNTSGENDFEIQSSVGSKLTMFLGDSTLYNLDSVVTILSANPGNFIDADLQLVFAYMAKTDYDQANDIITSWNNSGLRPDWVAVLTALINIEKNSVDGILSLENYPDEKSLFIDYCENDNEAQRLACAILSVGSEYEITEPHALPESGSARQTINGIGNETENFIYNVYPNPASTGFYFIKTEQIDGEIKVHDILGKEISTQYVNNSQTSTFVDISDAPAGLYLVTLQRQGEVIYKTKLAKQN